MHGTPGLTGALAACAVLLVGCAGASTRDADREGSELSAGTFEGPRLSEPVFDVPCTRNGGPVTGSPSTGLPSVILGCLGPGPAVDMVTLTGTVTVLNFWASWCDPCREEMPMLASVAEEAGDTVRFIGVNTKDQPEEAADFLATAGVGFEQLYDPEGELLRQLGAVQGLPVTLVLDAAGAVSLRHIGQIDEATLVEALESPS